MKFYGLHFEKKYKFIINQYHMVSKFSNDIQLWLGEKLCYKFMQNFNNKLINSFYEGKQKVKFLLSY
jgi:hypothetical protein